MIKKFKSFALFVAMCSVTCNATSSAQEKKQTKEDRFEGYAVEELHINPVDAKLPVPALKYLLMPPASELQRGNAAVHYGKVNAETSLFTGKERWEAYEETLKMPLAELRKLPRDRTISRRLADSGWGTEGIVAFYSLRNAALCKSCDFEIPFRTKNMYRAAASELGQTHDFTKLLALRARLQMADGRFDDAIETFQTGFAMNQHIFRNRTGWVFAHQNNWKLIDHINDWIEHPDAPNIYWALAHLPDSPPLREVDIHYQDFVRQLFPAVAEVHKLGKSEEFWRNELEEIWDECLFYDDVSPGPDRKLKLENLDEVVERADKKAKIELLTRGYDKETIASMPQSQRALLHSYLVYREVEDELIKWSAFSWLERNEGVEEARKLRKKISAEQAFPLVERFISPGAHHSQVTFQQRVRVLMTVELLRAYLSDGHDALPKKLSEIDLAPLPIDPGTGKPFVYELTGEHSARIIPAACNGMWLWKITTGER